MLIGEYAMTVVTPGIGGAFVLLCAPARRYDGQGV